MTTKRTLLAVFTLGFVLVFGSPATAQIVDSLPSWNDGEAKQSIIEFVATVTEKGSPDFVPPAERIAVFDNDRTLWAEQPMYFFLLFAQLLRKIHESLTLALVLPIAGIERCRAGTLSLAGVGAVAGYLARLRGWDQGVDRFV